MTGLLGTEHVARTTQLEVLERDLHPRAEFVVDRDRLQTVGGSLAQRLHLVVQEIGVGALSPTTDAAAQLVQLAESVLVSAVDDDRVRVRDVESGLDDGRRHEHVELALPEVVDDLFELVFGHLTVCDRDPGLRHQLGELARDPLDRLHPVVHEEHLAFAQDLASDRRRHLLVAAGTDEREDRMPVLRWRRQGRHLADAGDRHLQRARDRGRAHREDVDVRLHLLERVLVLDAEALLLVDDHQAQVLEEHLIGEDAVGADHHVDRPLQQALQSEARLLVGLEARQRPHLDREAREALGERLEVLLHEQRRRHEHRHLLAVLDRLERGTDGDLCLAEAHIA